MIKRIWLCLTICLMMAVIPALAESEGTETYCPTGENHEHSWSDWETVIQADCTQDGSRVRHCRSCGYEQVKVTTMLPHTFSRWETITEPTDHSQGSHWRICEVCGLQQTEDYDPDDTLRLGSYGDPVLELQQLLVDQGYLEQDKVDGDYGDTTSVAVAAFQRDQGLEPDGVAWPQTRDRLSHDYGGWTMVELPTSISAGLRTRLCRKCGFLDREVLEPEGVLKMGSRGESVLALQRALRARHYNTGTPDGKYGIQTEAVVKQFQRSVGMTADGIAWPGVVSLLIPSTSEGDEPGDLILTMALISPDMGTYEQGDKLDFIYLVMNDGDSGMTFNGLFTGSSDWAYGRGDDEGSRVDHYTERPTLRANLNSQAYGRFSLTVDESKTSPGGLLYLYFRAGGTRSQGAEAVQSNVVVFSLPVGKRPVPTEVPATPTPSPEPTATPAPTATPEVAAADASEVFSVAAADLPPVAAPADEYVTAEMVLTNVSDDSAITLTGFDFAEGDTFDLDGTAFQPIPAGGSLPLNYVIRISDGERQNGWGVRDIRVEVYDETNDRYYSRVAQARFAVKSAGVSAALFADEANTPGGRVGDTIEVPLILCNNGEAALSATEAVIGASGGAVSAEGDALTLPEAPVAAGEGALMSCSVTLTEDDRAYAAAHKGQCDRTVWLHLKDEQGGVEIVATVSFMIDIID